MQVRLHDVPGMTGMMTRCKSHFFFFKYFGRQPFFYVLKLYGRKSRENEI